MSIHSSLKISGALAGARNVWTRVERLNALKQVGLWEDGDPVTGLPKVRTRFRTKSKKQLKAEADGVGGEVDEAAEGGEAVVAPATEENA